MLICYFYTLFAELQCSAVNNKNACVNGHTFVIPAYKDAPHLEECVIALLNQKRASNILIATSTPSAYIEEIATKYKLPYFISQERGGIANDWNFAVSKASTRWVTIAHQDDIYHQNYTYEMLGALERYAAQKPLIAFSGYVDLVNGKERKTSVNAVVKRLLLFPFWFTKSIRSKFLKKAILCFGDPICCPSVTIDTVNTKGMHFSEDYACVLDWVAWLQLASTEGAFVFVPQKLVQHRIHNASETTNQIRNGTRLQEEQKVLTQIWGKPLAKLISKFYAKGHNDNSV